MEITEGKSYLTREGKVVGPIERTKALDGSEKNTFWAWRFRDIDEGWLHWTVEGKWFRSGAESPRDLVAEASSETAKLTGYTDADKIESFETFAEAMARTSPMTKRKLLELAIEATADRGLNYGKPEQNFERIAAHWNTFLINRFGQERGENIILTPVDVAIMMALMKIARLEHSPTHQDSWVDLAGYAACGAEIALAAQPQKNKV